MTSGFAGLVRGCPAQMGAKVLGVRTRRRGLLSAC